MQTETGFVRYSASVEGISLEHVARRQEHNMNIRHFHDECEIFYILEGQRQFFFSNRSFLAGKGDLILIDSDMIHMTCAPEGEDPSYERIILYVTSKKMQQLDEKFPGIDLAGFLHKKPGIYHLDEACQGYFQRMCQIFREEETRRLSGYVQAIEAATVFHLIRLFRALDCGQSILPQHLDDPKYKFAYQIADYLTQHFSEQHSLDELAAHFYISKFYMCRLFRKVVGYSVSEYLTILRVQKACEYLEKTKLSVSAIAERVGYNSLTHFEREFKRYTQVSPLRYRNTQYTVTAFDVTTDFTPQGQPLPQEES